MKKENDLGRDKISSLVLKIALPSMLAQFVSVLYSIVDRMYIGHIAGAGETALAGVEALAAFIKEIGLPTTLTELGIPADTDLRAVADSTNITAGCCKKLTHDEIYEILLECK